MRLSSLALKCLIAAAALCLSADFATAQKSGSKFPKNTSQGHGNLSKAHKGGGNSSKAHKDGGHSHSPGQSPYRTYRPDYHDDHNHPSHGGGYNGYPYGRGGGGQLIISPNGYGGLGLGYYGRNFSFSTGGSSYYQPSYNDGYFGSAYGYEQPPYYGYYTPGTVYDSTFSYPPYTDSFSNLSAGTVSDVNPLLENRRSVPKLSFPAILTKASAISAQQRAEAAFRDGKYDEAAKLSRQAVRLDEENGLVHLFASQTQFAIGNYDQAAVDLLAATSQLSSDKWSHVVKNFRAFYGKNDYVSQTDRLSQFLLRDPSNVSARAVRGFHYGSLGYPESASEDFYIALAAKPDDELINRLLPVLGTGIPSVQPTQKLEEPVPPGTAPRLNPVTMPEGEENVENAAPADRILRLVPQTFPVEMQKESSRETPTHQIEELPPGNVDTADSVLELNGPGSD